MNPKLPGNPTMPMQPPWNPPKKMLTQARSELTTKPLDTVTLMVSALTDFTPARHVAHPAKDTKHKPLSPT